ncbi:hypothetical protein J8281_07250 [Aquimarina sp. U1-2]|uniref:hypothetical protein n=1 Tax=Aquimarina sp. U1-2 TaxID=2823141 RepID=UPI001AECDFA7|nr:hypothetical protein [Aquimarina sp. U1-2]MBP2831983.1 hypothetical protein [Aquimarina sp. U1-2]
MNIKLYKININTREEDLNPIELDIDGRLISYLQVPCYSNPDYPRDVFFEERHYEYEYDNSYKSKFKKLKLNYRFMIGDDGDNFDDATIANLVGYAHLNYIQRIKLAWIFKRAWIQKNENIKWLAGLLISFALGYITAKLK